MPRIPLHKQPDLFGGTTTAFAEFDWDELSDAEKKKLSRAVIGPNFDDLDEDIQEYVHEHDPESAAVIETIHDFLKGTFDPAHVQEYHEGDGAEPYIQLFEDSLDSMRAKDLWEAVEAGHEDELQSLLDEGFAREEILNALKNYHNYDVGYQNYNGRDLVWFCDFGETEEQASLDYIVEIFADKKLRAPFQDEVDRACEGVAEMEGRRTRSGQKERSEDAQRLYELFTGKRKYLEVTFHVSLDGGVGATPDWEKIREDLGAMEGDAEEVVERPAAERVVYRYRDGAYVLNLVPSELDAEGKELGMCVGRKDMPYKRLVQRGDIAIWSVRTQTGRPKFTIEVPLVGEHGAPTVFRQVKGKGNRVPGFDRDMSERTFKLSEVLMIQELCEAVGIEPEAVPDLRPGLNFIKGLKGNPPKHGDPKHCSWCAEAAVLRKKYKL